MTKPNRMLIIVMLLLAAVGSAEVKKAAGLSEKVEPLTNWLVGEVQLQRTDV